MNMKEKRTIIRPNEIGIRNKCTLCSKRYANSKKEVYFYAESMEDNDDIQFNIEYHTEYSNGELQDGYAYVDIEELAEAYRMNDFNEIKQYFISKYKDDERAFKNIIEDMKGKGLNPYIDETEGEYSENGFFFSD